MNQVKPDTNRTPWIGFILLLLVIFGIGWGIYRKLGSMEAAPASTAKAPSVAVDVAPIRQTTLVEIRTLTGTLQASSRFVAAPRIAGRLERLHVQVGDAIERGQVVAQLEDHELRLAVEQARAELQVAQANIEQARSALDVAQREHQRVAALRQRQVASESELDLANAELKEQQVNLQVAQAQAAQREAGLRAAEVRLEHARVLATWPESNDIRVVGERYVDEGEMLSAHQPLVSILDINTLTAVVHVPERDYPRIHVGQPVRVAADTMPDQPVEGTIARISPQLDPSSRQATIEIELTNPDGRLKPGMFVRASVELGRAVDATTVPLQAIVRREGRAAIFHVSADRQSVRLLPVRTGIEQDGLVQLIEPLPTGSVVVMGQHLLSDGISISVHSDGYGSNPPAPATSSAPPTSMTAKPAPAATTGGGQ